MATFEDIPSAIDGLRRSLIEDWNELDEATREKLFAMGGLGQSPVDRLVQTGELIYAKAEAGEALPTKTREAAAGALRIAAMHGFHGLNADQRGAKAADVLEGKAVADPPSPKPEFAPPSQVLIPDSPAPAKSPAAAAPRRP